MSILPVGMMQLFPLLLLASTVRRHQENFYLNFYPSPQFFYNIFCFTIIIYLSLTLVTIGVIMILNFGDKETELIWSGIRVKNMPLEIQSIGRRKLRMLNNSQTINDLRIPPSNRLEKLSGNLEGYYSIRINDQWRIVFQWSEGQSEQVKIMDYH